MRSIKRPANTPPVPEAMKKLAVAPLVSATGNPRSATKASSSTERL